MLTTDRMKGWFEEVSASISGKESTLLNFLSVCDGPFNIGIVKWLGKLKHIEDIDQPFETLQRTYLVQRYSPYRWNIHHLISLFCVSQLNKMDIKAIHLALAQYYLKGFKLIDHRLHSENEFIWKVKACIQLQLAGDNKKSQGIIKNIQKTAKSRGFYETLKNLIENEIKTFSTRDTWLDYHYSHCCLITGKLKKGLDAIEPLLYTTEKKYFNKRIAFSRLYAEIIGSMGNPREGLVKLREALNIVSHIQISPTITAHAQSTEAWLLTLIKEYKEATDVCEKALSISLKSNDKLGVAVGFTRLGIIDHATDNFTSACEKFYNALDIFRELEEQRGTAWVLCNLALSKICLHSNEEAFACFREAIKIKFDIGECSMDYFQTLQIVADKCKDSSLLLTINSEIQRVGHALGELIL